MPQLTSADYFALANNIKTMPKKEQQEAIKALNAMIPELCKSDYGFYVWYANRPLWKPGTFHRYLCRSVQAFLERDTDLAYEILIIQAPPQHGKSVTVTEAAPSWCAGKWPDEKQIMVSYNDDTALRFTKSNKDKIRSCGKTLFNIEIDKAVDRADEFELQGRQGRFISRGIGGGITSHGCKFMFIDDPLKSSEQADSELTRERQWMEWNMTLKTRLAAHAKVVLIMTRWHEDDLAGRIILNEPKEAVTVINLPCEAEENDLLGRAIGDALAPEIGKDNKWLAQFKKGFATEQGTRAWNALFQGRPTSAEGNMLKRDWWQRYDTVPDMVQIVMSVDAAFKDGAANDFVSIQVWGKRGADAYMLDNDTRRMDFPETLRAIRNMKARYPKCFQILVEDKANGSAVIAMLKHEMTGIIPVEPYGSKVSRANSVAPALEAHQVWLPKSAPWVEGFIEECAAFPSGKHDDQVDAMTQALKRLLFMGKHIPGEPKIYSRLFSFKRNDDDEMRLVDWN